MAINGTIQRIAVQVNSTIEDPGELNGVILDATVYVADSLNPLWPGSALPAITEYETVDSILLATPAANYLVLYPV